MSTNPVAKKRVPKGDIKFAVSLNEEQKEAKSIIIENKITVIRGAAGSGKSMLASQVALDLLFKHQVEKIILTRPAVTSGEEIGYLPGDIDAKLAPYIVSIYDNMYRLYNQEKIDKEVTEGNIEIIPLGFMRGRNFTNCCVVIDETQNATMNQLELILTRMCVGSKIIVVGDTSQIDLKDRKMSGFDFLNKYMKDVPGFGHIHLKTNHRDPIVEDILRIYSEYR